MLLWYSWTEDSNEETYSLCIFLQILFQLRQLFKARLEPAPQSNGVVRFFCDPTFWAKNVVNLGAYLGNLGNLGNFFL